MTERLLREGKGADLLNLGADLNNEAGNPFRKAVGDIFANAVAMMLKPRLALFGSRMLAA